VEFKASFTAVVLYNSVIKEVVPRKLLCPVIRKMGILQEILVVIQKIYARYEAQVRILNSISVGFRTTEVLEQECGFSPTLFTIFLESVLYNWNKKCRRMGLPMGNQTIHHHLFADDQVIIAQDKGVAEYDTKMNRRISEMGLICNYSLNRVFKCRKDIQNIMLEHNIVSKSSRPFKYLVPILTYSGKCNEEVFNKIEQARKAKRTLNSLLWSKYVSVHTKNIIFYTVIESILRYGWEIWTLDYKLKKSW